MKKEFLILQKPDDLSDCFYVRNIVFVQEQKFAEEIEIDDIDDSAFHIILKLDDNPVATARYFHDGENWHLGRFCILKQYRKLGLGRLMLQEIEKDLKQKGVTCLVLSSQYPVRKFYEKCGYSQVGEKYLEENYPHIKMKKLL